MKAIAPRSSPSALTVSVQRALPLAVGRRHGVPARADLIAWMRAALAERCGQVTVRVVDEAESATLNQTYRHQPGPTNVLSFAMGADPMLPSALRRPPLGDIVICAPVVAREAAAQGKPLAAHWAHMVVHGGLHLLGYDHIDAAQAKIMERCEVDILATLGFPNPYTST